MNLKIVSIVFALALGAAGCVGTAVVAAAGVAHSREQPEEAPDPNEYSKAELALSAAIRTCSSLVEVQADHFDAAGVKAKFQRYTDDRDKALALDPAVKKTKRKYHGAGRDDAIENDPNLSKLPLGKLADYCDANIPETLAKAEAAHTKQREKADEEEKEKRAIVDAEKAMEERALAQLKGERKRLQAERGWPDQTSNGDEAPTTDKAYAKIIDAKWWMYQSMQNKRGEYLCFEYFDFKRDKVAKRRTRGICH